jgi:hypothetical protein
VGMFVFLCSGCHQELRCKAWYLPNGSSQCLTQDWTRSGLSNSRSGIKIRHANSFMHSFHIWQQTERSTLGWAALLAGCERRHCCDDQVIDPCTVARTENQPAVRNVTDLRRCSLLPDDTECHLVLQACDNFRIPFAFLLLAFCLA